MAVGRIETGMEWNMTTIFKTKRDIAEFLKQSSVVAVERDNWEGHESFKEVEEELVSLIAGAKDSPDFGEDWGEWLEENIDELLGEAVSIVA